MPRRQVPAGASTVVDDVPLWDALVAERRDPRPYEPLTIPASLTVPDDLMTDVHDGIVDALDALDEDARTAFQALGDVGRAAVAVFDELYPWPEPPVVDDTSSALASLDVDATLVMPAWPVSTEETS